MSADPCWLRWDSIVDQAGRAELLPLCRRVALWGAGPVMETALAETCRGLRALLGPEAELRPAGRQAPTLVIATCEEARSRLPSTEAQRLERVASEGFLVRQAMLGGSAALLVCGGSAAGTLYGVYRLLARAALEQSMPGSAVVDQPQGPLRMVSHWDNADGSVERGYAGRSIFFRDGKVLRDLSRATGYARMLASLGINSLCINNVNVHAAESRFISAPALGDVARLAAALRPWGLRLFLSVNFAAPLTDGGLATADPLDSGVRRWWERRASEIYRRIPDFGGFMVKADSEGRPGPFAYGRSHAEGANMLAAALAPHGGSVLWRCFVYNSQQDWRDRRTDRARAAYDAFKPLDGQFADNVVLQVKNGPMDFQVREPVSPLFGAMPRTNLALELQVTQEYTGQQRHLCCLVPQWKEYLDFDTGSGPGATLGRVATGQASGRPLGGMVGVSNVGDDPWWTGHILAQANLYGFGRLAWDPDLSGARIVDEWTRLTFGRDRRVREVVTGLLQGSWGTYESYTAPLGVGWMVNPGHHYGPNVDGYEYSRWGTYHLADSRGIGVDRSVASGSGFAGQYPPPAAARYESTAQCPDELLLFFHHVPYTHVLHSGKTVIQHIYDSHFDGAEKAAEQVEVWRGLRGLVDDERWKSVLSRLEEQREHAKEWRDVINSYFWRKSGMPDARGRAIP